MKTKSFLYILLAGFFLSNCKKDDAPVNVQPVHISSPADGAMVHDTVPILFSVSASLHAARTECYVDYQLYKAYDGVPSKLYFYANQYSKGSTHHYSMTVFTEEGQAVSSNSIALVISTLSKPTVAVNSVSANSLVLSWDGSSYNRLGYRVKRKEGNGSYSVIASLTPVTTSYTDNAIDTTRRYAYLVEVYSATDRVESDTVHVSWYLDRYHLLNDYTVPGCISGQIAFSPDGQKVVITNYLENNFTVINRADGSLTSLPYAGGTLGLAMSHNGSFFVTGGTHDWDTVKVWDLNSLAMIRKFDSESANYALVTNNVDDQLFVGGEPVRIYNLADGSLAKSYSEHHAYGRSAQLSHDESLLLTGGNDKLVKIYNTGTGALIRTLTGHTGNVGSAVFSADESKIISGSYEDRMLNTWDAGTGSLLNTVTRNSPTVSVCNGQNGNIIIAGEDGTISVMDKDGKMIQEFKDFIYMLSASYNARLDLVAGYGTVTGSRVKIYKKYGHWETD